MAYPNLSSDNDPGTFTVELTEKNPQMDQSPQIGFEGTDDKDSAPTNGEQRKLLTSDTDLSQPRGRLNTVQRVSNQIGMCVLLKCDVYLVLLVNISINCII